MSTAKIDELFAAAGSGNIAAGRAALSDRWKITNQALGDFRRKGYLPLDKAKDAAQLYPSFRLRDLVRPDIRAAMEQDGGASLLDD